MVLEGLNHTFSKVAAVEASRGELICNLIVVEECFEICRDFIVEGSKLWFEICSCIQYNNDQFVCYLICVAGIVLDLLH